MCEEYSRASADRATLDWHLEEVARLVIPSWSGSFQESQNFRVEGEKRTTYQYDATAAIALGRFRAVMESLLVPKNYRWQRLMPSNPYLMKDRATRLWFEDATEILFKYRKSAEANFQNQIGEVFTSLGAFGTGAVFIDKLKPKGLRYRAIHLGELYFFENHQGNIDRAIRRFSYTARQAFQRWGPACPKDMLEAAEKKPDTKFWFLHCVKPREDIDVQRLDYRGMKFASYYVSEKHKLVMEEGGYNSFPYAISRYVKVPGEVYGRSPAMEVLPAIKVLNEEKKTMLKQGQRVVDPVLLAADDGVIDSFSLKAGAINYGSMTMDGKRLVDVLPTGNLVAGKDMMDMERMTINDAFLITLFQILVDSPQMTATEVLERAKEKGILIAPTTNRQETELLGPLTHREVDVLSQQGLLPPMPPALLEAEGEYDIVYDNPASRFQQAQEASGLMRSVEVSLRVVEITQNPEPLDHYDWDVIVPAINDINAVPQRWLRSMDKVKEIREGRAKQQQTQTAIDAAPAVAGVMKAMQPAKKAA